MRSKIAIKEDNNVVERTSFLKYQDREQKFKFESTF